MISWTGIFETLLSLQNFPYIKFCFYLEFFTIYFHKWLRYHQYLNRILIVNTKGQVTLLRNKWKSYQTFM